MSSKDANVNNPRLPDRIAIVVANTATFTNADRATWELKLLPRGKHVMPWRIEDELRLLGASFVQAGTWRGFATRDGNLVTGKQHFSGTETAEPLAQTLGA